ncbi:MAG: excinuclease ABC subunit B [Candidatus Ryanbacteria bacterium CG10_big_fil_rev_8_21_14_0_10_43_42]|uniref:UvrABC system protein B n=1 Tax=Candidatus Ryanbacteria bacterium CG10_big_fil_rev_8_21_14_0_10_43_42 TaxID=1974864 RepID=A0A2M8KWC4_9BACT|nr:MAG: excinuclease ABC subunit B [Candidatus Ryanbacteria bacterium CG10_big_fil_rev_8_21_14_0_10_43_42]
MMSKFHLSSPFKPTGDQPTAIESLAAGIREGKPYQTLLGVTGSGKTFTMANVIERIQKPTLIFSHNKTLAAQLYQEFKEFFPENAVHYFVSYYDYYQPEAYIPQTDTYIEKDASINEFIDRLRHASTQSALSRKDVIIVASVSCIYGIGDPREYDAMSARIRVGETLSRQDFLRTLATLQYTRNDIQSLPGTFTAKGEKVTITSPTGMEITTIEFFGNQIDRINNTSTQKDMRIFPAKHFVTPQEKIDTAVANIYTELEEQLAVFRKNGKLLEAERLEQRTRFDMEMLKNTGYLSGVENYSRHLSFRKKGDPPYTLFDYFKDDYLVFIDESHITLPQIRGMYNGDQARKRTLVDHGFRLPSALDNRPLQFAEFEEKVSQTIYVSATPSSYELKQGPVIEQIIRPTGLLDPEIEIRPTKNQIQDLIQEIKIRSKRGERTLVTTITKRLAEDIADYLRDAGIKAEYIHADIKTLERPALLNKLRIGTFDALVGINLLREGLDMPEVSLVAILDADKEGFLRNETTLIQTMGRAARHLSGRVIMYADTITDSMKSAMGITERRRKKQNAYNKKHGIIPHAIQKDVREWFPEHAKEETIEDAVRRVKTEKRSVTELKKELEDEMLDAAANLDFERAAKLRDILTRI